MKKVLSVLAVAALFVLAFTSCKPEEKTYADYLKKQTKGWVLNSAISSPDYEMSNGDLVADLFDGYLYDWEKDYVIVFNENGSEIVKPGKTVAPSAEDGFIAETSLGNWRIEEGVVRNGVSYDFLYMYIPFVIHQDGSIPLAECQIITLNDDMLRIKYCFNDDEIGAKGDYEWTLTYVPAK